MNEPWEEFDLSALTYPQFLAFFFDRPVVGDEKSYGLFRSGIDGFMASNPATVVAHIQMMCQDFAELAKVYSPEQLDQGLRAVFGAGISCERYLFDTSVDVQLRINCVESMYLPFRDVVVRCRGDIRESFYWMWWDMILHTFEPQRNEYKDGHGILTTDQDQMVNTMYHTLSRILDIDHQGCQWCALHGIGHLYHPLARDRVQRYLDVHRNEFSDEDVRWVESCRDGCNI
jgi:hypothetical protein